jgi:hypothetical protein
MSDISQWMGKIKDVVWDSFSMASKDIMDIWTVTMVAMMRTGKQGYPSSKPIAIAQGRLARSIQGKAEFFDDGIVDDSAIVYERTIQVPYAFISEYGGNVTASSSMRRAMFAKLKQMGRYNKDTVWTHKAVFEHKPFEFVKDSIEEMTVEKIEPSIGRHMEEQLNKIPDMEVTIGIR